MSQDKDSSDAADACSRPLELLAPAGDWAAMEAALEAGADAVYLGLTALNARRRAKNFRPAEFVRAVEQIHARGARVYLTLNIDLAQREVGQAVRILELARQSGVDAVLVRDPALLAVRGQFPEIEFHFSTQTCIANTADVAAAKRLGASRVVLAREMTLREIEAASGVRGVRSEVFAQGALCFCVSGRCLLSSWAGGRSGNRGACTSPCRVPWTVGQQRADTPLSMRDLSTVHRLDELRRAGVAALKIEGRLKTAAWVRTAVGLYRRALNGEQGAALLAEAQRLGAYTGRQLTCDYLDGQRDELTGLAARKSASLEPRPVADLSAGPQDDESPATDEFATAEAAEGFGLSITVSDRAVVCRCQCREHVEEWWIPKTVVRRAHKAISIGQFLEHLAAQAVQGLRLAEATTNTPEYLLVPRAANALVDRVTAAVRQALKAPDELVRIELPAGLQEILAQSHEERAHASNGLKLGQAADRVRLDAADAAAFLKQVRVRTAIIEGLTPARLEKLAASVSGVRLVAALPSVFFEEDIPFVRRVILACVQAGWPVEVNSWGGLYLARRHGAKMEGGPGLGVLNSLAARFLARKGLRSVTLDVEADRRQWEEITEHCPVPCSLVAFGRPALLVTRVKLAREQLGTVFADRRGIKMVARRERGLCVFRPVEPFDLRTTHNERICVAHLVVDLVASPDPVGEWRDVWPQRRVFRFNYDRGLA